MILKDIYTDLASFSLYVQGLDSSVSFEQLNSSAVAARKQIADIITSELFELIVGISEPDEKKEHLKMALANLTLYKDAPFDVMRRRKANIDLYKNEQERIRRTYADNYFDAMDSLIRALTEEQEVHWIDTSQYQLLSSLEIKTAAEFDLVYPIDRSYLYFFRTIPIQREVLQLSLGGYFSRTDDPDLVGKLKYALAMMTVARSLRRFDPMELPLTIRNLLDESTAARQVSADQNRLIALAADLEAQARDIIAVVDSLLDTASGELDRKTSFNKPEDKIFLMP